MKRNVILVYLFFIIGQQFLLAENKKNEFEYNSDTLKSYVLNEVIVSSSSKETNELKTLPASITVLTPSQINSLKINSVKDLSMIIPNFFIPDYGSKLSTPVYIRGIGERATGQTIGVYVDNMPYLDKSTFDFDFMDIQRIEVLRGPQGTLYGRNAMGGIINIFTHSPLNYNQTKILLSSGNYGLMQAKAAVSHRLDDQSGLSVSGYYDSNDGYFTNQYTGKKADGMDAAGGRFRLDWQASKNLIFQYIFNYDYSDQGAFPYGVYTNGKIADPNYNMEGRYIREVIGNNLNISYENERILLTSSTGYQYFDDNMKMDTDYSPESIFSINQKQVQNAFTEEITIKSNDKRNFQWSFGSMGFYDNLHTNTPTTFGQDGVRDLLSPMINIGSTMNPNAPTFTITDETITVPGVFHTPSMGIALFHQVTYNNLFVKGLSVTAGIRVDYEKNKLDYNSSLLINTNMQMKMPPGTPPRRMPLDTALVGSESMKYTKVIPKLALKYAFDDNHYLYASVSNGYKSGGYNVNMFADLIQNAFREKYDKTFNNALSVKEAASYKPEYSWNYELGYKGELVKDVLYGEFAGYYIDVRDIQLTQFVQSGQGRIINNAASAKSFGGEVSLTAHLFNDFNLSVNYGYTNATFKNDTLGYSGKRIPFAPQNTLALSAVYNKNFHKKWIDNFNIQAQYNAAGRIYWTEANDVYQNFYGVLNAKASFTKGFFGLAFWAKNMLNEEYAAFYFESMGRNLAQRGKPMQWGIDLNLRF
ncbi:MAG: TonB-dependent receptor [Candidatus Azobacteroides sp.]|nr:TonB-dependent receptor [Candidatus Azobacteroides sp.]